MSATPIKKAMISSTARDLPVHRKQVEEACHRMSLFAEHMMENLTAEDADAVEVSLRLVEEADVYIGIFAHRYGYVPEKDNPDQISITEMEYNRAVELGIPRLVFFMHNDHDVKFADVETGKGAEKLKKLKDRIGKERVAAFFTSPADLRAHCIQALSQLKEKYKKKEDDGTIQFHYVHPMTEPPEPYVAHPYTLLQAVGLIGRQKELNLLTDWITKKGSLADIRIFNVIAIGGMGKSALTWHWFNNVAPLEHPNLAGRFWWSFYESDAYFENFVIRALAYVSRQSVDAVKEIVKPERERMLLEILDKEEHLLVLDGIERILIAYARMDAAHLTDEEFDKQTVNYVTEAYGLPESAAQSFTGQNKLRQTVDLRAGQFLRKLAKVKSSRLLISSRLYPVALQNEVNGTPISGCFAAFLKGLSDNDALALWEHFGVNGQPDELLQIFHTFEKHPLLLQALAGEVSRYRYAPGDFNQWRKNKPEFNPFSLPLKQVKSHILLHAMHGLTRKEQKVLQTISAFRMPAQYQTLLSILLSKKKNLSYWNNFIAFFQKLFGLDFNNYCNTESEFDITIRNLEDRGLVGWDKRANRYDLHPIVRGVVWNISKRKEKTNAYQALEEYFESIPKKEETLIKTIEDLTPLFELYNALIGLKKYEEACELFYERIDDLTYYRLGANQHRIELLEKLIPMKFNKYSELETDGWKAFLYNAIALSYDSSGNPEKSCLSYIKCINISKRINDRENLISGTTNLADTLRLTGRIKESNNHCQNVINMIHEKDDALFRIMILITYGIIKGVKGEKIEAKIFLDNAAQIATEANDKQLVGFIFQTYAQLFLWSHLSNSAKSYANNAWDIGKETKCEPDIIRSARLIGSASVSRNEHTEAYESLHYALTSARAINLVQEELPALIGLAELARQQGKPELARELLDDVWELAERGPYPLFHADACNVLCQIERDAGNQKAAIEAAEKAYRLAWCDGPPWAYHYGLENAKKHLVEMRVPFPIIKDE